MYKVRYGGATKGGREDQPQGRAYKRRQEDNDLLQVLVGARGLAIFYQEALKESLDKPKGVEIKGELVDLVLGFVQVSYLELVSQRRDLQFVFVRRNLGLSPYSRISYQLNLLKNLLNSDLYIDEVLGVSGYLLGDGFYGYHGNIAYRDLEDREAVLVVARVFNICRRNGLSIYRVPKSGQKAGEATL